MCRPDVGQKKSKYLLTPSISACVMLSSVSEFARGQGEGDTSRCFRIDDVAEQVVVHPDQIVVGAGEIEVGDRVMIVAGEKDERIGAGAARQRVIAAVAIEP